MSSRESVIAEMKFSLLVNEVQYNKELSELIKLARAYVKLKSDKLPQFNRRHIVILLRRLKKYSDELIRTAEQNWIQPESDCLDPDLIIPLLDQHSGTSYAMACIAYVDMLDETRGLVKRSASSDDLLTQVYSTRINCEKVLAPLQRLSSLRATLRKISLEETNEKKIHQVNQALDNISGILDRCYEILTSLHGPHYVAELDNILDFSLKLMTMRYNSQDEPIGYGYEDRPSMETLKSALLEQKDVPYISNEIKKSSHLSLDNFSSMDNSIMTLSSTSLATNDDQDIYELVEIPWKKINALSACSSVIDSDMMSTSDTQGSENMSLIIPTIKTSSADETRSESDEHLYEEIGNYCKSFREKPTKPNKEYLLDLEWKEVFRLYNVTEEMNEADVALKEAKYKIITTEFTYIKSLRNFMKLYYNSIELQQALSQTDFMRIFGNFPAVLRCSEKFLNDMLDCLQNDVHLKDISNIVRTHVVTCFDPYITHCQKYPKIVKLLEILLRDNTKFRKLLAQKDEASGETLKSHVILPCQRISALPVLLQDVLRREMPNTSEYNETILAFNAVFKLAKDCEDAVNKTEEKSKVEAPQSAVTVARSRSNNNVGNANESKNIKVKLTGLFTV